MPKSKPETLDLDSYADDSWGYDEVVDYDYLIRDHDMAVAVLLKEADE